MAMELPCKASTNTSSGFEIKVICVRLISSSKPSNSTMIISFPPRNTATSLYVNGVEVNAEKRVSMALNKNRVDRDKSETTHVTTNSIKIFGGSCSSLLPFEIVSVGGCASCCPLVVGELRKEGDEKWVMGLRERSKKMMMVMKKVKVDVCVVGRGSGGSGRPILLKECIHEGDARDREDYFKEYFEVNAMVK